MGNKTFEKHEVVYVVGDEELRNVRFKVGYFDHASQMYVCYRNRRYSFMFKPEQLVGEEEYSVRVKLIAALGERFDEWHIGEVELLIKTIGVDEDEAVSTLVSKLNGGE